MEVITKILEPARWAPSGDNEQPWKFEILDEYSFVVHGHDTRDWCVYDLDGRASQLALGALLESIDIAASAVGFAAEFAIPEVVDDKEPAIKVTLQTSERAVSPLFDYLNERCTQRRPMQRTPLDEGHKDQLQAAVGENYEVIWVEDAKPKWRTAKLLFRSAYIRLTIPEAYIVHARNIQWDSQFSEEGLPDKAIGLDNMTLKIMRWAMHSWSRVQFMNRFFAGTLLPRLQMDLLPGYLCAAHFMIQSRRPLKTLSDYLQGGRAMQRFWLTASRLGLQLQPEMTPLIFARYHNTDIRFTENETALKRAGQVGHELGLITGTSYDAPNRVFMGRLGFGKAPTSRSIRKPLRALLISSEPQISESEYLDQSGVNR